jgi:hypoxanthine-guanine phosphoribosyltransferase
VRINLDLGVDIRNRNVIIVEDIIDSGHTISAVLDLLSTRKPAVFVFALYWIRQTVAKCLFL